MRIVHCGGDAVFLVLLPVGIERTAERHGIDIVTECQQFIFERVHAAVVASEMEKHWQRQTIY